MNLPYPSKTPLQKQEAIKASVEGQPLEKSIPLPDRIDIILPAIKTIQVGISQAFHNKTLKPGYTQSAYSISFNPQKISPKRLCQHIGAGGAWTPGVFTGNRRVKENFISSQILAVDFDNDTRVQDVLMDDSVCAYASMIYPTPSSTKEHPKCRLVFLLEEPVTSMSRGETLQRGVMNRFSYLNPDTACKDATRLFYGSDVGLCVFYADGVLPLKIAGSWCEIEAFREELKTNSRTHISGTKNLDEQGQNSYAQKAYESELFILRTHPAADHTGRNNQLFMSACSIFGMVKGGWPGIIGTDATRELYSAGLCLGLSEREVLSTIKSAERTAQARSLPNGS